MFASMIVKLLILPPDTPNNDGQLLSVSTVKFLTVCPFPSKFPLKNLILSNIGSCDMPLRSKSFISL